MYCRYCGKQVDKDAVICPGCGKLTDVGNQVIRPAAEKVAETAVQSKAQKKEGLSKGTIVALTAFFCYAVGMILNTIVSTSAAMDALTGFYAEASQVGTLVVSGIFSIFTVATGVVSFIVSCIEKDSLYKRIFPLGMMLIGIWYFIDFICAVVLYAAMQ